MNGQIKYFAGITGKLARALTQYMKRLNSLYIKRLNFLLEAVENEQSFLSKPMLYLKTMNWESKNKDNM